MGGQAVAFRYRAGTDLEIQGRDADAVRPDLLAVVEAFLKAQKDGKIRYIGFSAHSEEAAHAAMDRFDFDSVLFPLHD